MSNTRIICLGAAVWDTIFSVDHLPPHGGKVLPTRAVQGASGMAIVAAVTVARLGGTVDLLTRIGDDATGRMFVDDLAHERVATTGVRRVPGGRTAISTVLVDRHGERLVVPYFDPTLDPDPGWLPLETVAGSGAVLCDMRWVEGARALFAQARSVGVPTILDADVAPVADLRALMPWADHVLFSEPALASLVDIRHPEQAVAEVARQLNAKVIGVTLGEHGSVVWERDGGGRVHRFSTPRIHAVDTLNAGDVWHGTYAHGLAQGWGLARTVQAASVAAAIKCETFGGRAGAPTLTQLLEGLQRWESELS